MRLTKIHLKTWGRPALLGSVFALALFGGWFGSTLNEPDPVPVVEAKTPEPKKEQSVIDSFSLGKLATSKKGEDDEPATIASEYEGFQVVGYMSSGNSYYYQLRKDKETISLVSNQRMLDRMVKSKGSCNVVITSIVDRTDTITLTDPTCFNTHRIASATAIGKLKFQPYCNDYGCIDVEESQSNHAQRGRIGDSLIRASNQQQTPTL